jgi:hypothetical protein
LSILSGLIAEPCELLILLVLDPLPAFDLIDYFLGGRGALDLVALFKSRLGLFDGLFLVS